MFQVITIEAVARNCFFKEGALKNFAKFTGKYLCWSLFSDKVAAPQFNKNETQASLFFYEFYENFHSTNFVENLRKAASVTKFGP